MPQTEYKPPYMPWYVRDFWADFRVRTMTPRQRACYRALLDYAWGALAPCNIPNEPDRLWLMADADSPEQWDRDKQMVLAMFTLSDDKTCFFKSRQLEEYQRIAGQHRACSQAGTLGNKRRWSGRSGGDNGAIGSLSQRNCKQKQKQIVSEQDKPVLSSPEGSDAPLPPKEEKPSESGDCLAEQLASRILENNPKAKISDAQRKGWAQEADRIIRLDRRTESEIASLIDWAQSDPFWRSNILSMGKLREHFDRLTLQVNSKRLPSPSPMRDVDPTTAARLESDRCANLRSQHFAKKKAAEASEAIGGVQ